LAPKPEIPERSYYAYGHQVRSALPLYCEAQLPERSLIAQLPALQLLEIEPGWDPAELGEETILFNGTGRECSLHSEHPFSVRPAGQRHCFKVGEVARFHWRSAEACVYVERGEEATLDLLSFWLIHVVLPIYLNLESSIDFLHAGGVAIDGEPVVFVAPSTGGKSTLVDYCLRQGLPLISDDKVAIVERDGEFLAVSSHPHHRPYRRPEDLGYPVDNFMVESRPVRGFYVLEQDAPDAEVTIEPLTGFRRFQALFPNYLFGFDCLHDKRMQYLARLVNSVPVYTLRRPWNLERMDEVFAALKQSVNS
jgi:hypothetical protein